MVSAVKAALIAIVALLVSAGTALAGRVALTASPSSVRPGVVVSISGNAGDCPAGDGVTIISRAFVHRHDFAGVPAVYARVRAHGVFSVRTAIPPTRAPGRYVVTARCGGGTFGIAAHLTVLR